MNQIPLDPDDIALPPNDDGEFGNWLLSCGTEQFEHLLDRVHDAAVKTGADEDEQAQIIRNAHRLFALHVEAAIARRGIVRH